MTVKNHASPWRMAQSTAQPSERKPPVIIQPRAGAKLRQGEDGRAYRRTLTAGEIDQRLGIVESSAGTGRES